MSQLSTVYYYDWISAQPIVMFIKKLYLWCYTWISWWLDFSTTNRYVYKGLYLWCHNCILQWLDFSPTNSYVYKGTLSVMSELVITIIGLKYDQWLCFLRNCICDVTTGFYQWCVCKEAVSVMSQLDFTLIGHK